MKIKTFLYLCLPAISAVMLLFGCSFFENFTVRSMTFFIPDDFSLPHQEAPVQIKYLNSSLEPEEQNSYSSGNGKRFFSIRVFPHYYIPVILYSPGQNPIGCIYPLNDNLTEAGGFCAELLFKLMTLSSPECGTKEDIAEFCLRFNWLKLEEKIAQEPDIRKLNQEMILEAIAQKSFTVSVLKKARQPGKT